MDTEIKDIFNESKIAGIEIPNEVYKKKDENKPYSFQHLVDELSIDTNIKLFTICALIGKYIVGKREKTGKTTEFFKYEDNKDKDEMVILKALAVHEVDNIYILKDQKEMAKIWEEYAFSGFKKLYEWYDDKNINLEEKLSSSILDAFEEKEKLENKK